MKSNPDGVFQSVWATPWLAVVPFDDPAKAPQPAEMVTITLDTLEITGTHKPTMPTSETYNMIVADWTAIKQETIANIVMGKVSVDEGLADYKKQAEALGVAQVLEEMNK